MTRFKHLTISLEGIEFQNGAFFKELVLVLGQYPFKTRSSLNKNDFGKLSASIDACVKKHTGVTIDTEFENFDLNGYTVMPAVDLNNPLWQDMNQMFSPGAVGVNWFVEKHGTSVKVNTSTGKISGPMTKIVFKVGLAKLTYINGKWNDEQFAAIILHEIGHLFSFFEFLDKTITTNVILSELDKQLSTNKSPKEREIILEKAGKALGLDRSVVIDASKTNDDKVVVTLYIANAIEKIRSETGNSFFDGSTWETLADQYAVRHGAGAALSSALDTIYRGDWAVSTLSTPAYFVTETFKMMRLVFTTGLGATAVGYGVATIASGGFGMLVLGALALGMSALWLDGDQSGESTPVYATAYVRMQRVRQQMVLRAKQLTTQIRPSTMQVQLLQDIAAIDELLKNFHDRQSWLDSVAAFMFSSVRNKQTNIKFQKELESLALNDLYVQSLSLSNV